MKKNLVCLRAYAVANGNLICCLNGKSIYINLKGEYVPSKSEKQKSVPVSNMEWFEQTWGKKPVVLNEKQIASLEKAFVKREKFLEAKKLAICHISIEEQKSLAHLSPDELFEKIMHWFKHFVCTPENQKFRDMLGFKLFRGPFSFINILNVSQKEEAIKAFKNFNPNPETRLAQLVKWVDGANKRAKILESHSLGKVIKGNFHLKEKVA